MVQDFEAEAREKAQQRKRRLLMNPNKVRTALWKPGKSENDLLKQELLGHKASLGDVKRQEREFLVELKDKIGTRYNKLKLSFEREYLMHDKRECKQLEVPEPDDHSRDLVSSKKQLAGEEKKHQELFEPLKSPCFGSHKSEARTTASLKERIKLNQQLTRSPKTGGLIGVNPNRRRNLDLGQAPESDRDILFRKFRESLLSPKAGTIPYNSAYVLPGARTSREKTEPSTLQPFAS